MSMLAGQSLTPYPWRERKKNNDARRLIAPVVKLTRFLAYIATILSPPTFLAWMWSKFMFRRYNDSWAKRGLLLLFFGIVTAIIFVPNPVTIGLAWYEMMTSFGPDSPLDPMQSILTAIAAATPWALIVQGLHALARSYQVEKTTDAFLKPQRPTPLMRLRARRNIKQLRSGVDPHKNDKGYVRFGVIVDDRIPWRQSRYGMIVERPIERMGHGAFIGSNGMGKTKAAETFTHYVLENDSAMIYIDFKASLSTMKGLSNVAREAGRPCYILDIGFGTDDTSWYDLFDWKGSPADKASVLVECFQFAEGEGGEAYYRGIAEAWLPMQIEAAAIVGLGEDEGMFDFLLNTAVPSRFIDRIEPMRSSDDPAIREKYERWTDEANLVKAQDLAGLRNELTKIVNAAGHRLKPNLNNPHPVSIKEVMDNGGMVYIGIASGVNDVVVKVLGSFLFRELSILVSERSRVANTDELRDVFVIPDEASEMEERAVMMNPLYTMAREARVFIWPSFQSFGVWDESTQEEIQSNARNFVTFAIPSRDTAEKIASTLPDIYALQQMSEEQTKQQAFQNQTVGISGDTRLSVATDAFLRPNIELSQVPIYHAYIWFKDSKSVSRDKWRGRRRVRKDEIRGDAPLVKLVPYDLVMPDGFDDSVEVLSDSPNVAEAIPLPDTSTSQTVPEQNTHVLSSSAAKSISSPTIRKDQAPSSLHQGQHQTAIKDAHWSDYIVTSPSSDTAPENTSQSAPEHDEEESRPVTKKRAGDTERTAPPVLPSFSARNVRGQSPSATEGPTEIAEPSPIPASAEQGAQEWVDDELTSGSRGGSNGAGVVEEEVVVSEPLEDEGFADDGVSGESGDVADGAEVVGQALTEKVVEPDFGEWSSDGMEEDAFSGGAVNEGESDGVEDSEASVDTSVGSGKCKDEGEDVGGNSWFV